VTGFPAFEVAAGSIDHPGTFVVHRHMLAHEDHEVMPPFQVVG
jgi:FtsP/CotA-like multicopper oxidase with cupredoxin domain